jgi:hypothetical protein
MIIPSRGVAAPVEDDDSGDDDEDEKDSPASPD